MTQKEKLELRQENAAEAYAYTVVQNNVGTEASHRWRIARDGFLAGMKYRLRAIQKGDRK